MLHPLGRARARRCGELWHDADRPAAARRRHGFWAPPTRADSDDGPGRDPHRGHRPAQHRQVHPGQPPAWARTATWSTTCPGTTHGRRGLGAPGVRMARTLPAWSTPPGCAARPAIDDPPGDLRGQPAGHQAPSSAATSACWSSTGMLGATWTGRQAGLPGRPTRGRAVHHPGQPLGPRARTTRSVNPPGWLDERAADRTLPHPVLGAAPVHLGADRQGLPPHPADHGCRGLYAAFDKPACPTSVLNRFLEDAVNAHSPPQKHHHPVRLNYMTQHPRAASNLRHLRSNSAPTAVHETPTSATSSTDLRDAYRLRGHAPAPEVQASKRRPGERR